MSEEPAKTGLEAEGLAPYLRIWGKTLGSVLGQIAGEPLPLEAKTGADALPVAAEVFLNITLAGGLRGEQALGLPAAQARWLAGAFTGEPPAEGASSELTAEQREAVEELFRQVAGQVVSVLKPLWGEVQIHVQTGEAPSWSSATTASLQSPLREGPETAPRLTLELRLSAALAAGLRRPDAETAAGGVAVSGPATAASSPPPTSATASIPRAASSSPGAVNLDFLKDVPLDLTLRFGQRRMLLREILELGPGSVIELDRRLKEPVDLLLDGRVLARGEVVVVQGCYGLRVTQIAARGSVEP